MGALETVHRRKLTLDEYHRIGAAGVLGPGDRIELIDAEMIEMVPIGTKHLAKMLALRAGGDAIVSTQHPIALPPRNELQPDVALLKPRADDYENSLPVVKDVLLVIELADTTIAYDREVKLPIYAQHAIPEVWLFDLQQRTVFVHRAAGPQGYRRILTPGNAETISPMLLPNLVIDLTEVWR